MQVCKNCGAKVDTKYCGNCGQKTESERITFHYLWHEILHFLTHAEKGFFFTTWSLVKAPEQTIGGFIEGKRKNYQKPVSYFLIWIAIYSLVLYGFEKYFGENKIVSFVVYFGPGEKTKFAISHLNIVLTLLLPIQAVYLYFILTKGKYNYFEALVAILYGVGTVIFLQTGYAIIGLIYYFITGNPVNILWSDLLKIAYITWMMICLVKILPVKAKYFKMVVVIFLLMGTFTAWRLYVSPGLANLFFK